MLAFWKKGSRFKRKPMYIYIGTCIAYVSSTYFLYARNEGSGESAHYISTKSYVLAHIESILDHII